MNNVIQLLSGKRTYVVAITMATLGLAEAMGWFTVPEWAWGALSGIGLGFLRLGVANIKQTLESVK